MLPLGRCYLILFNCSFGEIQEAIRRGTNESESRWSGVATATATATAKPHQKDIAASLSSVLNLTATASATIPATSTRNESLSLPVAALNSLRAYIASASQPAELVPVFQPIYTKLQQCFITKSSPPSLRQILSVLLYWVNTLEIDNSKCVYDCDCKSYTSLEVSSTSWSTYVLHLLHENDHYQHLIAILSLRLIIEYANHARIPISAFTYLITPALQLVLETSINANTSWTLLSAHTSDVISLLYQREDVLIHFQSFKDAKVHSSTALSLCAQALAGYLLLHANRASATQLGFECLKFFSILFTNVSSRYILELTDIPLFNKIFAILQSSFSQSWETSYPTFSASITDWRERKSARSVLQSLLILVTHSLYLSSIPPSKRSSFSDDYLTSIANACHSLLLSDPIILSDESSGLSQALSKILEVIITSYLFLSTDNQSDANSQHIEPLQTCLAKLCTSIFFGADYHSVLYTAVATAVSGSLASASSPPISNHTDSIDPTSRIFHELCHLYSRRFRSHANGLLHKYLSSSLFSHRIAVTSYSANEFVSNLALLQPEFVFSQIQYLLAQSSHVDQQLVKPSVNLVAMLTSLLEKVPQESVSQMYACALDALISLPETSGNPAQIHQFSFYNSKYQFPILKHPGEISVHKLSYQAEEKVVSDTFKAAVTSINHAFHRILNKLTAFQEMEASHRLFLYLTSCPSSSHLLHIFSSLMQETPTLANHFLPSIFAKMNTILSHYIDRACSDLTDDKCREFYTNCSLFEQLYPLLLLKTLPLGIFREHGKFPFLPPFCELLYKYTKLYTSHREVRLLAAEMLARQSSEYFLPLALREWELASQTHDVSSLLVLVYALCHYLSLVKFTQVHGISNENAHCEDFLLASSKHEIHELKSRLTSFDANFPSNTTTDQVEAAKLISLRQGIQEALMLLNETTLHVD